MSTTASGAWPRCARSPGHAHTCVHACCINVSSSSADVSSGSPATYTEHAAAAPVLERADARATFAGGSSAVDGGGLDADACVGFVWLVNADAVASVASASAAARAAWAAALARSLALRCCSRT